MKFTCSLLTLALAAGVIAAPKAALEDRAVGIVVVEYFSGPDCTGDWLENNVYVDRGVGECIRDSTVTWKPYVSWRLRSNSASRPLNVFSKPGCTTDEDGTVVSAPAGATQCYNQHAGSAQFVV